ncbi:MAG: ArgE/DapE family deacylase [Bacteroidetes bacterium]|nr:ArgE/DapE family deacylase [Bacteroidota bacterium]
MTEKKFGVAIDNQIEDAVNFLCEIIKFPSTRGKEGAVNKFIYKKMESLCDKAELIQIPETFSSHPNYSWQLDGLSYTDTQNVRLKFSPDVSTGKSLIINAHSDVVPPSKNQIDAFNPKIENGKIFGRGACDDKGQIAAIYLALRCLNELKLKPSSKISIDIVIEEENGGNGTLFAVQNQIKADAAIVLEPSEFKILSSVRGAVWFEVKCIGKPTHSGSQEPGISAIKMAVQAMNILEEYHDELLRKSRGSNKLFDGFENPMPITFGMLNAGDWPATVPATASVKGIFGFLPNVSILEVQNGMRDALKKHGDDWLRNNCELVFEMLNNEGNQIPENHPLVESLKKAESNAGITPVVSAMTAACDAWQYVHRLNVPTVVVGAGSLSHAHSNIEQIEIVDIRKMAKALLYFIDDWCGLASL